ncbi:MAG: argininosuccinate lyase, partial [Pyrinomonadaceae bacterium]|nr:argininosuccinate lyase [Pyrinomonadaceae bacterium]
TELADYLARKGLPFREAHDMVGRLVLRAIEIKIELHELPLAEMQAVSPLIGEDVYAALTLEQTLSTKAQIGGTAPARVAEALNAARKSLGET